MAKYKVGDYVYVLPVKELVEFTGTFRFEGDNMHYGIYDDELNEIAELGPYKIQNVYQDSGIIDYIISTETPSTISVEQYLFHESMLSPYIKRSYDMQLNSKCMDDFISTFYAKDCT